MHTETGLSCNLNIAEPYNCRSFQCISISSKRRDDEQVAQFRTQGTVTLHGADPTVSSMRETDLKVSSCSGSTPLQLNWLN